MDLRYLFFYREGEEITARFKGRCSNLLERKGDHRRKIGNVNNWWQFSHIS